MGAAGTRGFKNPQPGHSEAFLQLLFTLCSFSFPGFRVGFLRVWQTGPIPLPWGECPNMAFSMPAAYQLQKCPSPLSFTQPALLPCPGAFFTQAPLTWDSFHFLWDNYIFPSPGKPSPALSLQSPRLVRNISRDIWVLFFKECVCVCLCVCAPLWPGLGTGSPGDGVIFVLETIDGGAGTQSMALW